MTMYIGKGNRDVSEDKRKKLTNERTVSQDGFF
jgi:hypothetical protein